ncbi:MAG: hypothetical protein H6739_24895 [Alphaproteobacteria bacterium]|nr:hypothetical protein [Alphaproteobacteria bacterium]
MIRHAVIAPTDTVIAPFGDPVAASQVLARSLHAVQVEALEAVGLEVVDAPPADAPYLLLSDRTWVTEGALRRFLDTATPPARLQVTDPTWLEMTLPLQELSAPGVYEVALLPAGAPPRFDAPPVAVDMAFEQQTPPVDHPAMAHAVPAAIAVSDGGVHQIDHWLHVLRVNWLAMSATIAREKRRFEALNVFVKVWRVLGLLLRARSLNPYRLGAALTRTGKGCRIHPTAVVEASVLGDGVEIGPFAVVRGSVLGDNVKVEEHSIVNASVLGDGAVIGRKGTANLCVLYPGAKLALGNGYQACVLGRDSFVAWSVTIFDISFKGPIKVWHKGERVSSGTWFLGAAIGHRAKVGAQVTLGYGTELPNDSFLVGPTDHVLRRWEPGEGPHRVVDGVARPVRACQPPPKPIGADDRRTDS